VEFQLIAALLLAVLGVLSVAGAVWVWRAAQRLSVSVREFEVRFDDQSHVLRGRLISAPQDLIAMRSRTELALWTLERLDRRLDAATVALAAQRRGSDTLRAQLLADRARLSRIRDGARMLLRAIELRRELLG
jgi:hypothetical protein